MGCKTGSQGRPQRGGLDCRPTLTLGTWLAPYQGDWSRKLHLPSVIYFLFLQNLAYSATG
jgi:hypothetical protein